MILVVVCPICCGAHIFSLHVTDIDNLLFESVHEKTNNLGFHLGPTQTRLYSHRVKLKA